MEYIIKFNNLRKYKTIAELCYIVINKTIDL